MTEVVVDETSVQKVIVDEKVALAMAYIAYMSNEWVSNDCSFIERQCSSNIKEILNDPTFVSTLGGQSWDLCWGAACWQAPLSRVADHTVFIVRSRSNPHSFIISICGTNPLSLFAWLFHDFDVGKTVNWPTVRSAGTEWGQNSSPKITKGTARGLELLSSLKDSTSGKTIIEFLKSEITNLTTTTNKNKNEPFEITVCGHSLGGGLSPAFALFLSDLKCNWDNSNNNNTIIKCFSFAGPTIGNESFARYYDAILGPFTQRIASNKDIVPHAWQDNLMSEMLTLYEPTISTPLLLKGAVGIIRKAITNEKHCHVCIEQPMFAGPNPIKGRKFMLEVAMQHVRPYIDHAGIGEIVPLLCKHVPLFHEMLVGTATELDKFAKFKLVLGLSKKAKDTKAKEETTSSTPSPKVSTTKSPTDEEDEDAFF